MEKIQFNNNNPPALSKEVLEALQDNIENAIEEKKLTELYFIENPTYVTATLKDSISNYSIIVVIGQSSDGHTCSAIIYKPSAGKQVALSAGQVDSSKTYNKQAIYRFTAENIIESIQNYEIRDNIPYLGHYIKLKAVLGINW